MFGNHCTNKHKIMVSPSVAVERHIELPESTTWQFDLFRVAKDSFPK